MNTLVAASTGDLYAVKPSNLRGDDLIRQRVSAIPDLLDYYMKSPFPQAVLPEGNLVAVGIGSSLAHAKYLQHLLRTFTDRTCDLGALVDYFSGVGGTPIAGTPILFSQGVSENAHPAVEAMIARGSGVIFTAASSDDNKLPQNKRALLERAVQAGVTLVPFPLASEYQVLVRVVGPFFGYVAAHRFVSGVPNSRLKPLENGDCRELFSSARATANQLGQFITAKEAPQIKIITTPPTNRYADNLADKIKEGVFLPRPEIVDPFEFDHGALQNACHNGSKTIILSHTGAGASLNTIVSNIRTATTAARIPQPLELSAPAELRPELRILFYEMVFNYWLVDQLQGSSIDQVSWPGKGLDKNYLATRT